MPIRQGFKVSFLGDYQQSLTIEREEKILNSSYLAIQKYVVIHNLTSENKYTAIQMVESLLMFSKYTCTPKSGLWDYLI